MGLKYGWTPNKATRILIAYFKRAAQSPFLFPRFAACAGTSGLFLVHGIIVFYIKYAPKFKCPPWLLNVKHHYSLPSRCVCSLRLLQSGLLFPSTRLTGCANIQVFLSLDAFLQPLTAISFKSFFTIVQSIFLAFERKFFLLGYS